MVERYAGWLIRWRWGVVMLTLAWLLAAAWGVTFLGFSNDYRRKRPHTFRSNRRSILEFDYTC